MKADYPWNNLKNYAVFRHNDNRKWFCLIMDITPDKIGLEGNTKVDVINLKVRNEFIGPLRKKTGFYPAYHMDKSNWITINLNEINSINQISDLIAESYELTS
nr:MmcQ/YjbR family DNA-binding protein [Priestia megaterium]MDH3169146.1 MmcQ/YjbR family DNA-binding protein [Priestia megaterium]MDH3169193.1 MmcQ/YjbR family DNA-binding protein [Priestia megaterium]